MRDDVLLPMAFKSMPTCSARMAPAESRRAASAFMMLVASTVALVVLEGGMAAVEDSGETAGVFIERRTSPERTGTSEVTMGAENTVAIITRDA